MTFTPNNIVGSEPYDPSSRSASKTVSQIGSETANGNRQQSKGSSNANGSRAVSKSSLGEVSIEGQYEWFAPGYEGSEEGGSRRETRATPDFDDFAPGYEESLDESERPGSRSDPRPTPEFEEDGEEQRWESVDLVVTGASELTSVSALPGPLGESEAVDVQNAHESGRERRGARTGDLQNAHESGRERLTGGLAGTESGRERLTGGLAGTTDDIENHRRTLEEHHRRILEHRQAIANAHRAVTQGGRPEEVLHQTHQAMDNFQTLLHRAIALSDRRSP